jgi:hypothetical protein
MKEKTMFGVRLNEELTNWINDKSRQNKCSVSEIICDAIILAKKLDEIPEDVRFSQLLHVQASKAAIITCRLLEKFIQLQNAEVEPREIIASALKVGKEEINALKI